MPPTKQTAIVCQSGKSRQKPIKMRPGSTRITLQSVPAADACVWTMLFSRMPPEPIALRTLIEMIAAGMEEAKVMPVFRPR